MCVRVCGRAGANPAPYDYKPFFYSREFNLSWQFFGTSDAPDSIVAWGDMSAAAAAAAAAPGGKAPRFGAYWVKGGRVVGAFIEGPTAEETAALRAVVAATPPAPDAAELQSEGAGWALAASSKL
jgi:monodehydroascorbate reductase (NADH)